MGKQYIDKHEAYMLIKHEAETHELPESKNAYERAAQIVDQMRPKCSEQPEQTDCEYCHEDSDVKGRYSECNILFCPMCGRRLTDK